MKITMEIDMSPEEVRKVMGLPDVEPMQKELMAKMQPQIKKKIRLRVKKTLKMKGRHLTTESQ